MAPINNPNGNEVSEIVLPNGNPASEVIAPDGTQVFGAIPDSGVSRWEFEQDYADSWNGYDGTDTGGPTFTTDNVVGSYALDHDGVDDRVDFGTIAETEGVSEVSIGVWVKPRDLTDPKNAAFGAYPNNDDNLFLGQIGGEYYFRVESGGNSASYIAGSVPTDSWEHWALTFNSGVGTFYINGSEVSQDTTGPATTSTSHGTWRTGYESGGDHYFDAIIDDPRIYSKELTSSEVSDWYSSGTI